MSKGASVIILGKRFKAFIRDLSAWDVGTYIGDAIIEVNGQVYAETDQWLVARTDDQFIIKDPIDEVIGDSSEVVVVDGNVCEGPYHLRSLWDHYRMWWRGDFATGATTDDGEFHLSLKVINPRALLSAARNSNDLLDEQSFLVNGKVDVNECLRTLISPYMTGLEILDSGIGLLSDEAHEGANGISSISFPKPLSADEQSALVDKLMHNLIEDVSKEVVTGASNSVEYCLLKIAVARYLNSRL
jgi:hypothetical protein